MNGLLKPCYDRIKAIYAAHIGFERNRTVLDLGCGSRGNFLNIAGGDYTGIDSNPKIISALSRRGNGRYLVMDAGKLEFGPGCFDVIVSTSLFHHLNDRDCRKVCAQMRTVLKHDGRIIVADGVYPRSWLNIAGRILRFCDRGRYVRNRRRMRVIFEEMFFVEKEYYFEDRIFAYYVLVLGKQRAGRTDT